GRAHLRPRARARGRVRRASCAVAGAVVGSPGLPVAPDAFSPPGPGRSGRPAVSMGRKRMARTRTRKPARRAARRRGGLAGRFLRAGAVVAGAGAVAAAVLLWWIARDLPRF